MPYPTSGSSSTQTAVRGIPDTVYVSNPIRYGADADVDEVVFKKIEPTLVLAIPDYVENVAIVSDSGVTGMIRATAYPYWMDYEVRDTMNIDVVLEWNLRPRPTLQISQADTIFYMDSIWFEEPRPFLTEPIVVAGGTIIGIAILYGIVESIKGIFND